MKALKEKAKGAAWFAMLAILFGPFAIVYLFAFLGLTPPSNLYFGVWFMGALTISGAIATIWFGESIKQHGWKELGCVLPIAGVTCWWGFVFLKMVGFVR
ncbi:MAG TPA: hypothetical protein VFR92_01215 [Sphingomicrobium sp.]|nr:hypothetical protein [Sphingomicrobium sp.]